MDKPPAFARTTPPFVGRTQYRDWLERCMQVAMTGHPQVILISGEAGIGKTRLLKEMQAATRQRAVQVFYNRCHEDWTLPYLPFIEALLDGLAQTTIAVESSLAAEVKIIQQFLHGHRAMSSAPSPAPDQDRLRLIRAVARGTIALAQRVPILLMIDDLHWADPPSLDLLGHLVFTVADTAVQEPVSLLMICAYREEELTGRLGRLVARLQREDICQTFALPGLDTTEIRELIHGLDVSHPSHQLVTALHGATRGNPLFIQEVLHHLRQRDALRERGGYVVTTAEVAALHLPEHITGALVARTHALSPDCQRVLTLAALLGEDFSLQLLSIVSGSEEEAILDALEEGIQQGILACEGQVWQFTHPLMRQVLYTASSPVRRQRLHVQIAQALENLYADDLEAHILEIAHHLIRAGPVADVDKVVQYARKAGDQALAIFAWSEAARNYSAALFVAESTHTLTIQEQAELHYRTGLAYHRDQDVGPCLDHYDKAIAAYRMIDDAPGLAQALMGKTQLQYTLAAVSFGTLLDVQPLEDILARLADRESGLCGSILTVLAEVYWIARDTAKAQAMAVSRAEDRAAYCR